MTDATRNRAGLAYAGKGFEGDASRNRRVGTLRTLRAIVAIAAAALLLLLGEATDARSDQHQPEVVETPIPGVPHASIFRLPGNDRKPVVVILAGAEGNDDGGRRFGPMLARLGYSAVSLPYYSPDWGDHAPPPKFPNLPGSFIDIRVEQLAQLRDVLADLPGTNVNRFGLFGGSKGAEFALIAASHYDWITSVVAYAPSDLVWEGWGLETVEAEGTRSSFSVDGKPLPFMPYRNFFAAVEKGPTASLRPAHEKGRSDHPGREAAARIPVEKYAGSLMLVAGDADRMWNSGRMARNIVATREAAGIRTQALIYPDAGHDLAGGSTELRDDPRGGGTPQANASARADAWPKVVAFLALTLEP